MPQTFTTLDRLRLDVELPAEPGALRNLIANPNGELGGWGWVTPVANTAVTKDPARADALRFETAVAQPPTYFLSEALPVTVGHYVAARLAVFDAGGTGRRLRLLFLDAAGAQVSAGPQTSTETTASVTQLPAAVVPAGAQYVQLRVDVGSGIGLGNLSAGQGLSFGSVVVAASPSSSGLGGVRRNLFPTPSFEAALGAGTTPGVDTNVERSAVWAHVGTYSLRIVRPGSAPDDNGRASVRLNAINVTPGKSYAVQLQTQADTFDTYLEGSTFQVSAVWFASGAVLIGEANIALNVPKASAGLISGIVTAPSGANSMRLDVRVNDMIAGSESFYVDAVMVEEGSTVGSYFDGSFTDAGGIDYSWAGTAHGSQSIATEAAALAYIPPIEYLSILGTAHQLTIDRTPLDANEAKVNLRDAELDPSQSDTIRPGRRCRLCVLDPTDDVWHPLFTAKIRGATVDYELREPKAQKRARIELTATDANTELAAVPRSEGVASIGELPHVLEGAGVPWNVNGSGNQVPTAAVVAIHDQTSALDQIALTRDSTLGVAWVDRANILQAWDRDQLPTTPQAILTEADYTNLVVDYDTARAINHVTILFLRTNPDSGDTEEVPYGPYVDQTSIEEWGTLPATFTIQWADEDPVAIEAHAAEILAANATPAKRVNSVTIPIRNDFAFAAAAGSRRALLDLGDLVTVQNTEAGIDEDLRVEGVSHTIAARRWDLELRFVRDGQVASPRTVPPPSGGGGGLTLSELLRPVGEVTMLYGTAEQVPAGWLELDGSSFDGAAYPKLAAYLGGTVLPDFNDRFPIGASGSKAVGAAGGSATHTLTVGQMPSHSHTWTARETTNVGGPQNASPTTAGVGGNTRNPQTSDTGGGNPFSIMPPWRAIRFIIRAR